MSQSTLQKAAVDLNHSLGLPLEILNYIFLMLPAKSLSKARWTCKLWLTVISDANFIENHLNYSTEKYPGYLYGYEGDPTTYFVESSRKMLFGGGDGDEEDLDSLNTESIHISSGPLSEKITTGYPYSDPVRSAGGLIGFISRSESCVYVWNPIIREQITVPFGQTLGFENIFQSSFWALGYVPSSKEYKILLLRNRSSRPGSSEEVQGIIYTLGRGSTWRSISDHLLFRISHTQFEDCVDGISYFLVSLITSPLFSNPCLVCCFDFGLEKFRVLKGLLADSGGFLHAYDDTVAYLERLDDNTISIWVLRDKVNDVWIKECNISPTLTESSHVEVFFYIGLWMHNIRDFFGCGVLSFVIYDSKREKFRRVTFPFSKKSDGTQRKPCFIYPHIGSLVSPKRIMATPTKALCAPVKVEHSTATEPDIAFC